ncbi:rho guanine nucleotide exchange factor 39-like [Gigantopelta aegis]|uniref:rho guanine nucleotide exchange factor 39-like n=1 Tax=Gigantopelta aegis TaxID=1735272 RepID=UPI001B8884F1|nr:rho guanine nucleotide exchange factor 39-like [Gigantopelta aegis]
MLSARSRLIALSKTSEGDSEDGILFTTSSQDQEAKQEAKRERRRRKLEKELFETELAYIYHLELIHKYFDFPLRFACLIPEDAHARLFSNVEQLLEVNRKLLDLMEQTSVGQAFRQIGPFLKLYSTYANGHEQALSVLQEWKQKKPEFSDYIKTQEARPEVQGLTLNALLITPVQRIPRYKLLLEGLLEHTPKDHHDYHSLHDATSQIADIAMYINDHIRQHENFEKMLNIQKSFDRSAPKILTPGRQFIREGVLKKVARRTGKAQERMFFLFSDVLLYGKPKLVDSGKKMYSCCCVLPLKHCHVEPVFITNLPKLDGGGMFMISCKDECLLLYSDDTQNAKSWTADVNKAISKLCTDRKTLRKPSSNIMPLRGKSLRRKTRADKKEELSIKSKKVMTVKDGDDFVVNCSPIRERLEPMCDRIMSACEMDLSGCLTPQRCRVSQESDENYDSSNIGVTETRSSPGRAVQEEASTKSSLSDSSVVLEDAALCDVFPLTEYHPEPSTDHRSESSTEHHPVSCTNQDPDYLTDQCAGCCTDSPTELTMDVSPSDSPARTVSHGERMSTLPWKSPHRYPPARSQTTTANTSLASCFRKPILRILRSGRSVKSACKIHRRPQLLPKALRKRVH